MKNRIKKRKPQGMKRGGQKYGIPYAGKGKVKRLAGRLFACAVTAFVLSMILWTLKTSRVFAYNYVRNGAEEAGTVTVSERSGQGQVNGYGVLGGYRVTYTITREDWTAFDDRFGGYFVTGNNMDVTGGCQFAYHTSGGEIWEDGAVTLGHLRDGRQIARCDVAAGTVSCSFDVNSLEELPAYIAYTYEPASSAYIHINADMGSNAHVWFYKSLKDVPIIGNGGIDKDAPVLTPSVVPTGITADVKGKIWSTGARIQVRAEDTKSRPGGIRIFKDGNLIHEKDNPGNEVVLETGCDVRENGSFQADAYDKLNNTCNKISVNVSCIDRQAPDIRILKPETMDYVRETGILSEASDTGCGLHGTAYSWNGGAWTDKKEYKAVANGVYTLKVRDALGNESSKSLTVSNIDREGPEMKQEVARTGKMATCEGVLWSTEAKITAEAVDLKSGVKEIRILDEKGEILTGLQNAEDGNRETLKLEEVKIKNGSYKIWASDVLGNTGVTENFEISHVDGEAPIIKEVKMTFLEDGSVLLTVEANDGEGIGLDDRAYSFDGGKTWQKESSFTVRENGVCEVAVRDRLHQEAAKEKLITEVSIKEKPDPGKDEGDGGNDKTDPEEPDNKDTEEPGNKDGDGSEDQGGGEPEEKDPDQPAEPGNEGEHGENPGIPAAPSENPANVTSGANTKPGQNSPRMLGNASKNRKREKEKKEEKDSADSVSKNGTKDTVVTRKRVIPEKAFKDAEEKVLSQISSGEGGNEKRDSSQKEQIVRKNILIVLAILFAAGCIGLLLYLLLFYLRYSCVLYGVAEDRKKQRIGRLPVKEKEEEWQVVVPDHKLGSQGTGQYLLSFHPSFIKEEAQAFVIIQIDGKALREKLKEEISISI